MPGGRLKSGLIIPPSVTSVKRPVAYCTVIVDGAGTVCGKPLYSDRDAQEHSTRCAKRNIEHIRARSLKERMPGVFGPIDPEAEGWVRRNAREILEGRKGFYGKAKRLDGGKRK